MNPVTARTTSPFLMDAEALTLLWKRRLGVWTCSCPL